MHYTSRKHGFTLIEILVSLSIIALLSSVILSAVNSARKNARDSKRIASIRELQTGLELYFATAQIYPDSDNDSSFTVGEGDGFSASFWDTPEDDDFINTLVINKAMSGTVFDPLASQQANVRYYRFPAGSYGCPEERGPFYVLGIVDMEASPGRHQLSPGWTCPEFDFGDPTEGGFEFVVGKYER